MVSVCPLCSGKSFCLIADSQRLQEECGIREQFVQRRLTRPLDAEELKDLTDFFHGKKADLVACGTCGLLIRDEHEPPPAQEYSEDEYDSSVMEHQYPMYVKAFRKKEDPYRSLLPQNARVLEIGSHYGAFLQVASEWGWQAEGIDPGKDTSRFAKSKGFQVHVGTVENCGFTSAQFDAIFIWNCFEQIDQPRAALCACRRLLKRGGLLTVRTPDGQFYLKCEGLLRDEMISFRAKEFLMRALGYNNLLGFPYRHGYCRGIFEQFIGPFGFQAEGAVSSELLTFPLPESPKWVDKEEERISTELEALGRSLLRDSSGESCGPWIEAWFRAV